MQQQTQERLPIIDGFSFAETGSELRSRCLVAGFGRLRDVLGSDAGVMDYVVSGARDEMGRQALRVRITGPLDLVCQRCLKPMAYVLDVDTMLVLARSEAEIEGQPVDPEGPDRVVASREMAVGTLLEDEILLAIPFAPRHEQCSGGGAGKGEAQASPFANLRGLLNRGGRAGN